MVKVIVTGAAGKVGSAILRLALADKDVEVTGVLETKGHPLVGKPVEGAVKSSPPVADDLAAMTPWCDVIIDFTGPEASLAHFRLAAAKGKAIVIGTTGFSDEALREMENTPGARAVISPNMSVGMNLMFDIVEKVSKTLQDDYDIEIVEMHHRLKKDSPSGTAVKLMEIAESARPDKDWQEVFGRKGLIGERKHNEIGVLALRGGDVVGEHTVMFAGTGERLEITHRAYSRDNFARGAILAAKWIADKGPGIYTMKNVLGL
ncbi:MAG TPA: 4-hydroxy-tetrahydrodipicolinate reductase [Syntrophorhabdaceae bacterium]|jgi:4-hydroxy-tetrahydrodipicolinate reductase